MATNHSIAIWMPIEVKHKLFAPSSISWFWCTYRFHQLPPTARISTHHCRSNVLSGLVQIRFILWNPLFPFELQHELTQHNVTNDHQISVSPTLQWGSAGLGGNHNFRTPSRQKDWISKWSALSKGCLRQDPISLSDLSKFQRSHTLWPTLWNFLPAFQANVQKPGFMA